MTKYKYGNLVIWVRKDYRDVYYVTVLHPGRGYSITVETPENSPRAAVKYSLQALADGPESGMNPEWEQASEVLWEDALEAMIEVDAEEISMNGRPQQVECKFLCPGDKQQREFRVWQKRGESSNDACVRYMRERLRLSDYQIGLCEKLQVRYID